MELITASIINMANSDFGAYGMIQRAKNLKISGKTQINTIRMIIELEILTKLVDCSIKNKVIRVTSSVDRTIPFTQFRSESIKLFEDRVFRIKPAEGVSKAREMISAGLNVNEKMIITDKVIITTATNWRMRNLMIAGKMRRISLKSISKPANRNIDTIPNVDNSITVGSFWNICNPIAAVKPSKKLEIALGIRYLSNSNGKKKRKNNKSICLYSVSPDRKSIYSPAYNGQFSGVNITDSCSIICL